MAYTGQGYYGSARFNDQSIADAFAKAFGSSGALNLQAGQFFAGEGGTQYKTVAGIDPNQPGWGNLVEPGYELIGYQNPEMYTGRQRQTYGNTPKTPGFAILRKGAPKPEPTPAPKLEPTPEPVLEPKTPYQAVIPEIEKEVDVLEEKAPTIEDVKATYEADNKVVDDLKKQIEDFNERLKISTQQAVTDTENLLRPEFEAQLGQANTQIEQMRDLMIQQSQAFQGQTAAQKLDAQRQAEAFAAQMAQQQTATQLAIQQQQEAQQAEMARQAELAAMMYQEQQAQYQAQIQAQSEAQARAQAEAQAMAERQAQIYQSNITNLQSRLDRETAAYRSELQGLAESQRAFQINQARASIAPDFQISSTQNQQTGGTQQFKIRRPAQRTSGIPGLIPLISTLNL